MQWNAVVRRAFRCRDKLPKYCFRIACRRSFDGACVSDDRFVCCLRQGTERRQEFVRARAVSLFEVVIAGCGLKVAECRPDSVSIGIADELLSGLVEDQCKRPRGGPQSVLGALSFEEDLVMAHQGGKNQFGPGVGYRLDDA